jgi:hypothetical protein
MPAPISSRSIVLNVRGISIPAFKNRKRAIKDKRTGKLRTLTDPKIRQRLNQITAQLRSEIILAIGSELLSDLATTGNATWTGQQLQSWIATKLPLRDSRQWMRSIHIESADCDKGQEGAEIIIEKL